MNIPQLKSFMREHKITYEELSHKSGISISTIKKIFAGISQYPRIDTMEAIERALGLAPEWTDEEKALGVGKTAVVLSDQDEYRLTLLARADEVLGEDYTKAYLYALEIAIQQNLSK